jgi:integrase
MVNLRAPIMGKTILPALTKEQVEYLIGVVESPRDKAIISLFTESGLRLSELAKIEASDIDWQSRTIPNPRQGPQRGSGALWRAFRGISEAMAKCLQP